MIEELKSCPHCGGKVSASLIGSSVWNIHHLDDAGGVKEYRAECVDTTIYARASSADPDDNAEWNIMAAKWNRRASPASAP